VVKYKIKKLSGDEFKPFYDKFKGEVFKEDHSYLLWDLLTEDELSKVKSLGNRMGDPFKLYLAAFDENDSFMGWSWGFQESNTDFYMCNSAILPQFRKKGIYTAIMKEMIKIIGHEGFQLIYSKHNATNNAILIPKLKEGFLISKMEIDDKFGVLIHLHYYFNETRKKIMDYRSGYRKPDKEINNLLKI
jgi:hypothetical protein